MMRFLISLLVLVSFIGQTAFADELDEVNVKRVARGLCPFIRDDGLTQAARGAAEYRARAGLFGHSTNDFQFLPTGVQANAAGCAAYPASYGWLSCCTYDNCTHAGAAAVTGADGKRYMHLFVNNGGSSVSLETAAATVTTCAVGECGGQSTQTYGIGASSHMRVTIREVIRKRIQNRPRLIVGQIGGCR